MTTPQTTDANDHDEFEPAPPDKLYAHHCRQLSAMMDGELSPDEAKFMLRRLEHDAALAGCWERWQVCGDALRGLRHALLPADFAHRVALAIADDGRAAIAVSAARPPRRLARWSGGAALAASIAVVAFLVARQLPEDGTSAPDMSTAVVAQTPAAPVPIPAPAPAPVETAARTADPSPPGAGAVLATAAVAAAQIPRRASERRVRAQARRAPDRVQAREVAEQSQVVVAANLPVLTVPTTDPMASSPTDPFAALPIAPARPWPRAILSGYPADSAFSAGYGNGGASPGFDPFQPRLQVDPAPAPSDTDVDGADAGATDPGDEGRDGSSTPY